MKKSRTVLTYASIAVAVFTIAFIMTLIFTFKMGPWNGIEAYASTFKPDALSTVYPSIMLAVSFLIFNVSVFYCTDDDKKIWAHLAMNLGIVYATISLANYFIQLISVMPSVMNGYLNGLDLFVAGYPNSIFFALMASYFFMCLSFFFTAFAVKSKEIRFWLMLASAGCILMFIIGAITGLNAIMMIGAVCWMVGTVAGMLRMAWYLLRQKEI